MTPAKRREKQRLHSLCGLHWALLGIVVSLVVGACNQNEQPPVSSPSEEESPDVTLSQTTDDVEEPPLPVVTPVALPPLNADFLLATTLRMRFEADELTRGRFIRVEVNAGQVWLRGQIDSGEAAARAEAIAVASEGVEGVNNELLAPPLAAEALAVASQVPQEVLSVRPLFADNSTVADPGTSPAPTYEVQPPPEQPPTNVAEEVSEANSEPDASVEPTDPAHTYTVHSGDSLWGIANSEMGSGHRWEELYDANLDVIGDDPMNLRAGIVLRIP